MAETQTANQHALDAVSERVGGHAAPAVDASIEADASVQQLLAERQPGHAGSVASPPAAGAGSPGTGPVRARRTGAMAMLRSRDMVALQRMAGNTAVTGLVRRRSSGHTVVQRQVLEATQATDTGPPGVAGRPPRANPRTAKAVRDWIAMPAADKQPDAAPSALDGRGTERATDPTKPAQAAGTAAAATTHEPQPTFKRVGDEVVAVPPPASILSAAAAAAAAGAGAAGAPGAATIEAAAIETEAVSQPAPGSRPAPGAQPGSAEHATSGPRSATGSPSATGPAAMAAGGPPAPTRTEATYTRRGDEVIRTPNPPPALAAAQDAALTGAAIGAATSAAAAPAASPAPASPPPLPIAMPPASYARVGDDIVRTPTRNPGDTATAGPASAAGAGANAPVETATDVSPDLAPPARPEAIGQAAGATGATAGATGATAGATAAGPSRPAGAFTRSDGEVTWTPTPAAATPATAPSTTQAADVAAGSAASVTAPAGPASPTPAAPAASPAPAPSPPLPTFTRVGDEVRVVPPRPVDPLVDAAPQPTPAAIPDVTPPVGTAPQLERRLTRVGDEVVSSPVPATRRRASRAETARAGALAHGPEPGIIEMPEVVVTGTPREGGGHLPEPPRPADAAAGLQPNVIQIPEVVITAPAPRVIQIPEVVITASVAGPGGGPMGKPADAPGSEKTRGFPEKRTPPPARKPRPAPGAKAPARGGGAKAAPPEHPPLHDPTLEKWRAASAGAIAANKPGDLGDAKDAPARLDAKGQEIEATRKAGAVDDHADNKAKQPPIPAEHTKEQQLDTKAADGAVEAVTKAGDRHLTNQTFAAVDFSKLPAADGVTGRDFVSGDDRKKIADLEAKLAGKDLKPAERLSMTKDLERRKQAVAEIEGKPVPAASAPAPVTIKDEGPAKLTPPSAAEASLLGDAIARLLGQVDGKAKDIGDRVEATMHGQKVPRFKTDMDPERRTIRDELDKELHDIATAAGVTDEQLKTKIAEQTSAVLKEGDAVHAKLAASSVDATGKVQKRTEDEQKTIAGVKVGQDKEIADKQHAVEGPPDTAAIENKRDEFLGRVTDVGAQASAGLRASITKRETELESGANQKKAAIRSTADNRAAAIRRHWAADADPNMGMIKARPTTEWARDRSADVDVELKELKAAARAESDRFAEGVNAQVTTSKEAVRDWAAHQQGKERSWWDRLFDMIRDWGKQARANNEAWEKQRNAESRDAMIADFNVLTQMKEAQAKGNSEAVSSQFAKLSADQKRLANQYFSGGISGIEFVAQSTIGRISERRVPETVKKLEEHAIAAWEWNELAELAKATNPGFDPKGLAAKVRGAVAGWGTKEDEVYAALGGARTAIERAAMAKAYQHMYGVSMEADIKDDMEGHEMERAKALMEGRSSEANAAAIKEAVAGLGTDEAAIKNALRGKSKEELKEIKAEYKRMYHVELTTDLRDDMEDAELDNALALADGDVDKADAAELSDAMDGPGTDEEKIKKVYERIREEEEAKAKADGLTPGELKQRIQDRNAKVKAVFKDSKYGDLDARLRDELTDWDWKASYGLKGASAIAKPIDNTDLKIVEALQSGDVAKIDAAKAAKEHQSVYTSDDEIEAAVRNQRKQAELDVALDLAATKARIEAMARSGDLTEDQKNAENAKLEAAKQGKEAAIVKKAKENLGRLSNAYGDATNHSQTFNELIADETSGESNKEINELVAAGGKLSDEQELYYAIEGIGTDEDKIKEVLKGKTKDEIDVIRKAYALKHPGRTLDGDLLGDLSGREDLDVGHTLKYGDPETFARQLEETKKPEDRKKLIEGMKKMLDDRQRFEQTGTIGQIFALGADPMNSAEQLKEAVQNAEAYDKALTEFNAKNPDAKPADFANNADLVSAKANFDMNYSGALESQEQVRQQIDSYADVAVQVGAAATALAVTILTAGTAGPVMAALYGALAGAVTTMTLKARLRGLAYSWEEAGVDVAVGAVDAAMSAATAGLSKAIAAAEKEALLLAAKAAAKSGTEKVSESAVKAWIKEAMKEAVMNAAQGVPSAFTGAILDDNTWKSGDPWGHIASATGQGAAMGAGMGVAMKGAQDIGGAAWGKIKGAAKAEPRVDAHAPGAGTPEPHPSAGEAHPGRTEPHAQGPEPKPVEIPPEAKPEAVADRAAHGELPPDAHGKDLTKGGTIPEGMGPEPKPEVGEGRRTAEPEGRRSANIPEGGEPHVPGDGAVITEPPEGSVAQLPDAQATDPVANREFFENWHAEDPSREVALLRNDVTGEYVLVQGDRDGVWIGGKKASNRNWALELLSPEQLGKGHWSYEAHSHPTEGPKGVTPQHERWPSGGGADGDFNGVARESARTGKPVKEEIHFITENGREKLTYGYDPNADKPFFIERPGPDGTIERHEYKTINDYHRDFEAKFNREPGKPIADDFPGAREPIDHEAPTNRPGELEDKGVGRGSPGDDPRVHDATTPEPGESAGTRSKEPEPRNVSEAQQDRKPLGEPSKDDVGKSLSMDDLTNRYGMPEANVRKIEGVCADLGVIVDVRPTTPHAEVMLREGTALPKPEAVKAKTINDTDVLIGLGKKEDLGKVGFFDPAIAEPHRPADFDSLPKGTQDEIDKRIKQRLEEFADYNRAMKALEEKGLIRIEPDGKVINTGLTPGGGELPFTGDHDIFDIRAKDGSPLSPEQYQAARSALMAADAGVMHGGVTGWAVDSPQTFNTESGQKSYKKMVDAHSPGGKEPLVRLGDGDPKAVWYEPAKAPEGAPGAGVEGVAGGRGTAAPDPAPSAASGGPAPEPQLTHEDHLRLGELQDRLGDEGLTIENLGIRSEEEGRRFFAQFDSVDDALAELERRAARAIDIRQSMGHTGSETGPSSELGERKEGWSGRRASSLDRPLRDPWTAGREASEILGGNLGPPPSPEGYHAHHIIPESEGGEGLEWLRDKLRAADIDINHADNGVWLVGESGAVNVAGATPHTTYLHAGNRNDYLFTLTERLGHLDGPEFARELERIKFELANGEFKFHEAPDGWTPEDAAPVSTSGD